MTLDQLVASLDLGTVADDHAMDATLRPTLAPRIRRRRPSQTMPAKTGVLPPPKEEDRSSHQLRIKGPLAEGGMGRLMLAQQGGLKRNVAVKTLRDDFLEPAFAERLLREARVLALVEHPNIVPLHALDTDERNAPALVMKRIEGVPWRALIQDESHPAFPQDAHDRLAWHLRVFMRVCDAVHYAHSRGILHLDLKPDNVMVGAFREVYLVDWGVAVAIHESHRGWLPMADEVREILGTPSYLAPEMVDVAQQTLDVRTDVYLLGSVLHEILVGRPPHQGESLQELLFAAYEAKVPEIPQGVPRELARIVQKAMTPDRERRYQTVETLRSAVAAFLEHRSALELVRSARANLDALKEAIAENPAPSEGMRISKEQSAANAQVQRLFGRCRFGFAEALRQWPESTNAALGQREVLTLMSRYHLDRGEAASAEGLLDELSADPAANDRDEVRALREEAARQRRDAARLERLRHEESVEHGQAARGRLVLMVGAMVAVPCLGAYLMQRANLYSYAPWHTIVFFVVLLGVSAVYGASSQSDLLSNRRGRRIAWAMWMMGLMALTIRFVAFALGLRGPASLALEMTLFGAGTVLVGILGDRRMLHAAPGFLFATLLTLALPEHSLLWTALAATLSPAALAYHWLKAEKPS